MNTPEKEQDIVVRLRAKSYGHGAWGETESYEPSALDVEAAKVIEGLRWKLRMIALEKLTDEERVLLGV